MAVTISPSERGADIFSSLIKVSDETNDGETMGKSSQGMTSISTWQFITSSKCSAQQFTHTNTQKEREKKEGKYFGCGEREKKREKKGGEDKEKCVNERRKKQGRKGKKGERNKEWEKMGGGGGGGGKGEKKVSFQE